MSVSMASSGDIGHWRSERDAIKFFETGRRKRERVAPNSTESPSRAITVAGSDSACLLSPFIFRQQTSARVKIIVTDRENSRKEIFRIEGTCKRATNQRRACRTTSQCAGTTLSTMENESSSGGRRDLTPANLNKSPSISAKSKIPTTQYSRTMHNDPTGAPSADDPSHGSARRMATMKAPAPSASSANKRVLVNPTVSIQRRKLETQYSAQKKRYMTLRKELLDKNETAQKLFENISQLREKVVASGAKDPGKLDEIKLNEVGTVKPPPPPETTELTALSQSITDIEQKPIDSAIPNDFIVNLENQLRELPNQFQEFCSDVLKKYEAMLQFLAKCTVTHDGDSEEQDGEELISQLDAFKTDQKSMKSRLELLRDLQSNMIAELVKNTCDLYQEYDNSLNRSKQLNAVVADQNDLRDKLNAAMEELQRNNEVKERRTLTESQLQKSRTKVRELENHITCNENKIQQLQEQIKSLECMLKQKEQTMEQRTKDLQKALKNSHELVSKTEKQRDSFETRLLEVKEEVNEREAEMIGTIAELRGKIDAANEEINAEREKREQAEQTIAEMEERYRQLEEKSEQLCELARNSKDFSVSDGNHTENEVCLFNELKAARAQLEAEKEKAIQLQREKDEIVAVMHQAASRANEQESKEKLASELILKSSEIQALTLELAEAQKVAKQAQEKNGELEWQLVEIQNRLQAQSKDGGKTSTTNHMIELQQQVSDLRNALAEVAKHNEELQTVVTRKQLEIEQRDRVLREQSKFLKVRDELLCLMRGKDQVADGEAPSSEGTYHDIDEVNKQIAAKTVAIQELYATLESKQLQVLHLEKMVKQMEDQQDRAQAQRTRLENRIAQLELTLHEKTLRSKGFGIL